MSCNCNKAKPLPSCLGALVIGSINSAFDYWVYFKTATGRVDRFEGLFNYGSSLMFIEPVNLRIGTIYEVCVTRQTASGIYETEIFTVGDTELTCIEIEFTQVFDVNTIEAYETQTITLIE